MTHDTTTTDDDGLLGISTDEHRETVFKIIDERSEEEP